MRALTLRAFVIALAIALALLSTYVLGRASVGAGLRDAGDCSRVDWHALDADGRPFTPVDLDGDGRIACGSDLELGA